MPTKRTPPHARSQVWLPAAFCGVISLLALLGLAWGTTATQPAFFAFLPMCFLHSGFLHLSLQRRIERLEAALSSQQSGPAAP